MHRLPKSFYSYLLGTAALLLLQVGCGPATVPMSDANKAKELLKSMLTEWKSGTTLDAIKSRNPPIYVTEDLWRGSSKLEDYTLLDEGEVRVLRILANLQMIPLFKLLLSRLYFP